ncbi:hypothetical protein D3C72_1285270 [compost metagenome]
MVKLPAALNDKIFADPLGVGPAVDGSYFIKRTGNFYSRYHVTGGSGVISYISELGAQGLNGNNIAFHVYSQSSGNNSASGMVNAAIVETSQSVKIRFTQVGTNTADILFNVSATYDFGQGSVFPTVQRTNNVSTFEITADIDTSKSKSFTVSVGVVNIGLGTSGNRVQFYIEILSI